MSKETSRYKRFLELNANTLYHILKLRQDVFVLEQKCLYPDIDDIDQLSDHVYLSDPDGIIAYARVVPAGILYEELSIGRVVVNKSNRGKGLAREIMQDVIAFSVEKYNPETIYLSAQSYLERFYSSLGFVKVKEEYLEDGIPHIGMRLKIR